MRSAVAQVRHWWSVALFVVVVIVVQRWTLDGRYDVSGHAGEHLMGASAPFPATVVVATLLYATPRARRQASVLLACAAWLACTVLVMVGNLRVVDALVRAGMARTPTSELVATGDIESAHGLADLAPWLAVVAALAVAAVMWWRRHVSARVAVGAMVLSVLIPPWIIPGAGMLVVTVARCVSSGRAVARSSKDLATTAGDAGSVGVGGDRIDRHGSVR